MICADNSMNCYILVNYDGTNLVIGRFDSGGFNGLNSAVYTPVANDQLRLYRDGNDVVGTVNGVEKVRVTDTTYTTGNSGMFLFAGDLVFDDWTDDAGGGTVNDETYPFASRRNRPGRGPYSTDRYFRPRIDAITSQVGGNVFQQAVGGSLSFVGDLAKQTRRSLTATLTFSGAMNATAVFLRALTGAIGFAGSLSKQTQKGLSGAVSFAGAVTKRTGKTLTATLSFSGGIVKRTGKILTGTLSFAGALANSLVTLKAVSGVVSFLGTVSGLLIPFVPGSAVKAWRKVWQGLWRQVNGSDE
jgi:hypothetical protein